MTKITVSKRFTHELGDKFVVYYDHDEERFDLLWARDHHRMIPFTTPTGAWGYAYFTDIDLPYGRGFWTVHVLTTPPNDDTV